MNPSEARQGARCDIFPVGLEVTGEVVTSGDVELHGRLTGRLCARNVLIGPEGVLEGEVTAEGLDVRGRLKGLAVAAAMRLRANCAVEARLRYKTCALEAGAVFEGEAARERADKDWRAMVAEFHARSAAPRLAAASDPVFQTPQRPPFSMPGPTPDFATMELVGHRRRSGAAS